MTVLLQILNAVFCRLERSLFSSWFENLQIFHHVADAQALHYIETFNDFAKNSIVHVEEVGRSEREIELRAG